MRRTAEDYLPGAHHSFQQVLRLRRQEGDQVGVAEIVDELARDAYLHGMDLVSRKAAALADSATTSSSRPAP